MAQEKLNSSMLITFEQELAANIHANSVFEDFKNKVDFRRRMIMIL